MGEGGTIRLGLLTKLSNKSSHKKEGLMHGKGTCFWQNDSSDDRVVGGRGRVKNYFGTEGDLTTNRAPPPIDLKSAAQSLS